MTIGACFVYLRTLADKLEFIAVSLIVTFLPMTSHARVYNLSARTLQPMHIKILEPPAFAQHWKNLLCARPVECIFLIGTR